MNTNCIFLTENRNVTPATGHTYDENGTCEGCKQSFSIIRIDDIESITASHDRKLFDYLTNMESITDFFKENGLLPFWKKELEYAASRYLLATFLKRASSLSDEVFEEALERSLAFLKEHFPHWKRNSYLIRNRLRGFYLLIFTPTLARLLRKRNQL